MRTPQPTKDIKLPKSNREEFSPKHIYSCLSTQLSSTKYESTDLLRSLQIYLSFKKKLLRAMQSLDPLDLLDSGIFEEYQHNIGISQKIQNACQDDFEQKDSIKNTVTDFQTVIRSYEVSQDCKILQLEKRSKSCEIFNRFKNHKLSDESAKNINFFIQASINKQNEDLKKLEQKNHNSPYQQLQNIKNLRKIKEEIHNQKDQLDDQNEKIKKQNSQLRQKCSELQMIISSLRLSQKQRVQNDQHKLQYLLKEKQLQKRLNEAKTEIQQLRNMLEKANQQPVNEVKMQEGKINLQKTFKKPINSLRQRVQNEGRVKRVLQQLWGSELLNECNMQ